MASQSVSKIYAKALFELAEEKSALDQITDDFASFVQVLRKSPNLGTALSSTTFSVSSRLALADSFIEKVKLNEFLGKFTRILVEKNRFGLIEEIFDEYRLLVDARENVVRGTVTTVEPLSDAEIEDLSKAFTKKMNKTVILEPKLDKDILGGLVVDVQGLTFDGSLKTTMQNLRENLERQSL